MADITLGQMLKHETVLGVFSRLKTAGNQLSTFYSMRPESPGTERAPFGRTVSWDIFDNTRQLANARAPYVGPDRTKPKPVGKVVAGLVRLYESIDIIHEKVYGTRSLGGQYGSVDRTGQSYVGRQVRFGAQRMANAMEFMVSRMFRNGFAINVNGEQHELKELDAGTINVNFQIPSGNTGQVPLLESNANVISAVWSTAGTEIITDLLNLNRVSEAQSGYPITEFWISSTILGHMIDNTQLQDVAGSAYRIFDTMTGADISTTDGTTRPHGLTVIFRAMPQYNFHIYDAVLVAGGAADSTDLDDTKPFIPIDVVLATPAPEPGGWHGLAVGGEPIRENDESEVDYKEGVNSWSKRMNDPPGEELRILANLLPILYIPKAVFYMTVTGF